MSTVISPIKASAMGAFGQQPISKIGKMSTGQQQKLTHLIDDTLTICYAADALANDNKALAQELFACGAADRTKVAIRLAQVGPSRSIEKIEELLKQGADPVDSLVPLVFAVNQGKVNGEKVIPLLSDYWFAKEGPLAQSKQKFTEYFDQACAYSEQSINFLDEVVIYALRYDRVEFAMELYDKVENKLRIDAEINKYIENGYACLERELQKEKNVSGGEVKTTQNQLERTVLKLFAAFLKWFSSLNSEKKSELGYPRKIDLEEFPLINIALTA